MWSGGLLLCLAAVACGLEQQTDPADSVEARPEGPSSAVSTPKPGLAGDVCPPFLLRDEEGEVINPVTGQNADRPYSPKQTCGACHDYDKITKAYHFQQGADEKAPEPLATRCQWVSSPGNYGGAWCSPAPLYSYLAPKHNHNERLIDMTSFTFVTRGCGACHPGGGPLEYDREGRRYDRRMAEASSGLTPGGKNNLDGDYYQARWSQTGVLEADCLLCHLPEYDFAARNQQLGELNFRWAPTAAAGLARVEGAVARNEAVTITYDLTKFDTQGRLSPHIVGEPRDAACLQCHAKPGWKKRGANFRPRTDVHLAAGLRCVDCHPAGSQATDPRIKERELHQIAKGDDPGGLVRDDLDDTVRDCVTCHTSGELGAPIAQHPGLPPLHLEELACTVCHIPFRYVKAAQAQLSDVFNPGAKIPTKGKHLWTFYGPDMRYWNHYGDLEMMGYDDKPTDQYRPLLARYQGKIYPVNRVHSSWPGIELENRPGLMQPRMSDIYAMWSAHHQDPTKHPRLAEITDDDGDEVMEINRPQEIDALLASITAHLRESGYPMDGKRVVWVCNDRVYGAGSSYRLVEKREWEASPYGNVHKYSHDVLPARAALGTKGCTECHSFASSVFFAPVPAGPLDEEARMATFPQYRLLQLSPPAVFSGVLRECYAKPIVYLLWLLLVALGAGWCVTRYARAVLHVEHGAAGRHLPWLVTAGVIVGLLPMLLQPELRAYALPSRAWLDHHHFLVAVATMVVGLIALVGSVTRASAGVADGARPRFSGRSRLLVASLTVAVITGLLMELSLSLMPQVARYSYTLLDVSLIGILLLSSVELAAAVRAESIVERPGT